jgi:hypothetical protein
LPRLALSCCFWSRAKTSPFRKCSWSRACGTLECAAVQCARGATQPLICIVDECGCSTSVPSGQDGLIPTRGMTLEQSRLIERLRVVCQMVKNIILYESRIAHAAYYDMRQTPLRHDVRSGFARNTSPCIA